MGIIFDVLAFAIASVVMVKAGSYAIKSLTAIGKNLKIGHFLISFFLVGLVSALPEGFVSIISAFQQVPNLGFGALIGSAIADLTLVTGIVALVAVKTKVTKGFTYEIWLFALISLMLALGFDGTLSRIDGAILIGGCTLFFFSILQQNHIVDKLVHSNKKHLYKNIALFIVSATLVFFSADYVVDSAMLVAADFEFPLVVIGLIFIPLATTLPEAVFAISAARKKLADVAIGELFGVIIIDSTLLIGLIAAINPIAIASAELTRIAIFALTSVALGTYFIRSDRHLTWKEGIVLVFFYILFVITELTAARPAVT